MKVQQHSVLFAESKSPPITDWLWIDYHDRTNVLVEAPPRPNAKHREFYIFEQSKYALEGKLSKAIIGGIIEPGESPEDAARREVEEELHGMKCQDIHSLGRFRTDVNRGMGWVNSFLASNCARQGKMAKNIIEPETVSQVGEADMERQDLRRISQSELQQAVEQGEFVEVQWSNTVALALLHLRKSGSL